MTALKFSGPVVFFFICIELRPSFIPVSGAHAQRMMSSKDIYFLKYFILAVI